MTEPVGMSTRRPGASSASERSSPLPTIAAAVALFFVAFEFLASELRSGRDPSLGAAAPPRSQVVRKVLRTKVVTDVSSGAGGGGTTTVASQPTTVSSGPAPASTPVVTSSS